MYQFDPITPDLLLTPALREQLETALTDLAFALRQEGVATDARGQAKGKIGLSLTLECDVASGALRLHLGVTGTPVKLRSHVMPVEIADGVLHLPVEEAVAPRQVTVLDDPARAQRQAEASAARRQALEELAARRERRHVGGDDAATDQDQGGEQGAAPFQVVQ